MWGVEKHGWLKVRLARQAARGLPVLRNERRGSRLPRATSLGGLADAPRARYNTTQQFSRHNNGRAASDRPGGRVHAPCYPIPPAPAPDKSHYCTVPGRCLLDKRPSMAMTDQCGTVPNLSSSRGSMVALTSLVILVYCRANNIKRGKHTAQPRPTPLPAPYPRKTPAPTRTLARGGGPPDRARRAP